MPQKLHHIHLAKGQQHRRTALFTLQHSTVYHKRHRRYVPGRTGESTRQEQQKTRQVESVRGEGGDVSKDEIVIGRFDAILAGQPGLE